jgi:hypothetical protein
MRNGNDYVMQIRDREVVGRQWRSTGLRYAAETVHLFLVPDNKRIGALSLDAEF